VDLPSSPAQSHFCTATHMQLSHQEMSFTVLCQAQADTYLRHPLDSKGNCNLNYSAKSRMKNDQRRPHKAPVLPGVTFTKSALVITWPSQLLARFTALVLLPMPPQHSPVSYRFRFLKHGTPGYNQSNVSNLGACFSKNSQRLNKDSFSEKYSEKTT